MSSDYANTNVIEARYASGVAASDFEHAAWAAAGAAPLARYWSGAEAPLERRAEARLVWDDEGLVARFVCRQAEPLNVSAAPRLDAKTIGLWERDVCEVFITPETAEIARYFEFEAAPTGEWLDLALRLRPAGRETDWHFRSGMQAAARCADGLLTVGMRLPWRGLGRAPRAGERWRINLFRCVGAGAERGYLAWQPTHTPEPSFHVPEKFGWVRFVA